MDSVEHRQHELIGKLLKERQLDAQESQDLKHCHQVLTKRMWALAQLENLSLMASMTDDTDWQHQICAEIDQLGGR